MRLDNVLPSEKHTYFAEAFDPRNNAFGFFRLSLAVAVVFSHSVSLGGFGIDRLEAWTNGRYTLGLLSVAMFFILSGFLICRSASNSPSVFRFLWHRFIRIYPGYWVCLIMCGCVFAPLMALSEFGTPMRVFVPADNSSQSFILNNAGLFHLNEFSIKGILFIRPQSIAGLLGQNPVRNVINGSLWTLPFEGSCYLAVAILAAIGVLRRARVIVVVLFAALWSLHALDFLDRDAFQRCFPYPGMQQFAMLGLFFSAGAICFLYRESIPSSPRLLVVSLVALCVSLPIGTFGLIAPIALPYAFLWLAFALRLERFDRRGDFSYGVYIYAFPVQQGLALLHFHDGGLAIYFASSLLITLTLAFLSYHLVEAPCLRLKTLNAAPVFRQLGKHPLGRLSKRLEYSPLNQ